MIRPFSLSNEAFEDLVIGNNLSVEMPSWPSAPVFHKDNTTNYYICTYRVRSKLPTKRICPLSHSLSHTLYMR